VAPALGAILTKGVSTELKVASYREMRIALWKTGLQANHLNQNAAFRSVIPRLEGKANAMAGNAFTEIGSPHYEFHKSLEEFWDRYRPGGKLVGKVPTAQDYDLALRRALRAGGVSDADIDLMAKAAKDQRLSAKVQQKDKVPRVPGRINQRKK
jgi:hypothetical protein